MRGQQAGEGGHGGGGADGIGAISERAVIAENSVHGNEVGIAAAGDGNVITRNRVGLSADSDAVVGNTGSGILIESGRATVSRNLVAGNRRGIDVEAAAYARLEANRVWRSTEEPIAVADGPEAPILTGVVRTGTGDALRTTLLVGGLPDGGGGRLEVFANGSCDDPEAQYLMETVRTTKAGQIYRIIQMHGGSNRDHFTVTYTDPNGSTSVLSECASVAEHADGDGDGSVDPLDGLLGVDDDPTTAVVVTDAESLLAVTILDGGGRLERVELGVDPAPDAHPEGWELAYGALGFRVTGLEPGDAATVGLAALDGDQPLAGSSYWKYGPETPGAGSSWYDFDPDDDDETGATLTTATVLGAARRVWLLELRDGARGDSDGGANGTITDPGGPVVFTPVTAVPVAPTAPAAPVVLTAPAVPVATPAVVTQAPAPDALPRTGSAPALLVLLGGVLLVGGAAVLVTGRRRVSG